MRLGLATTLGVALFIGLVLSVQIRLAAFKKHQRQIVQLITTAGYESFGPSEGYSRTFRSETCAIRVEWDRGYVDAAFAPRNRADGWVSVRVLRESLFGEAWDPAIPEPFWNKDTVFVETLSNRLSEMAAAVTSVDSDTRASLAATELAQRHRWEEHLAGIGRAYQERQARRRKQK